MSERLEKAKEILASEELKFVLINDETTIKSKDRGVKPLLDIIRSGGVKSGFTAADMVVGKAAALLYMYLGVKEIYGRLMSQEAMKIFEDNSIYYEYTISQPYIKNRDLTDMCPMDKSVRNIDNPEKAVEAIKETVRKLMEAKRGKRG